ncbi:UvrABC system C [Gossypium arboreum]|uniref:UvrABC system C n=1 Tax=Gossypium arboreum TaxID=29729 RepID=A0A0B0NH98_GOSAR|nr:UvrABC system C [Gossypium arboreum]
MNREDHKKTDHDSHFSEWKLLICPHDWKNGKGGAVTRYRFENLPKSSGPGIYELAVCKLPSRDRRGKLEPDRVVYVGEAENIRARLQQYGRDGTHLCRKNGFGEKGCPSFDKIFARGCSIIYRWARMKSKAAAQRTEAQLLEKFDYAWNKGSNGARRHNDILRKLDKHVSNKKHLPIKIKSNKQVNGRCRSHLNYGGDGGSSFTPRWLDHGGGGGDFTSICGAPTCDGAPCERPVNGNGRCWQHSNYGRSSSCFTSRSLNYGGYGSSFTPQWLDHGGDDIILICGATTYNGAPCERPVSGNGRCWQHWIMAGTAVAVLLHNGWTTVVVILHPFVEHPPAMVLLVRDRLVEMEDVGNIRIMVAVVVFFTSRNLNYGGYGSSFTPRWLDHGGDDIILICGATTCNGAPCERPVIGNGRCWQHLDYGCSSSSSSSSSSSGRY